MADTTGHHGQGSNANVQSPTVTGLTDASRRLVPDRTAQFEDFCQRRDAAAIVSVIAEAHDPEPLLLVACDLIDARVLTDPQYLAWADELLARLSAVAAGSPDLGRDATRHCHGGVEGRCRVMLSHSHVLSYSNRFSDAIDLLDRMIRLASDGGARLLEARGRMALIHPLSRIGRVAEAIEHGEFARTALKRLASEPQAAPTLHILVAKTEANLGVLHKANHDPQRALDCLDAARPAFTGVPAALAQLDSNRGEALLELGEFDLAEQAFTLALESLRTLIQSRAAAIVEGNLADLMGRLGRIADSTASYERARRLHESVGAVGDLARLQAEQAELFAAAGMLIESKRELLEACAALTTAGMVAEEQRARRSLISVLLRLGERRAAELELEKADRSAVAASRDALEVGRWGVVRGEVHRANGRLDESLAEFRRALPLLESRRVEWCIAAAQTARVLVELPEGGSPLLGEAMRSIEGALAEARKLGLSPLEAECLAIRAAVRIALGVALSDVAAADGANPNAAALEDLRRAAALIEGTRRSLQADRLRSAFAASSSSVHEAHVALLLGQHAPRIEELFAAIEAGRHRSLLDCIGASAPLDGGCRDDEDHRLRQESARLHTLVNGLLSGVVRAAGSDAFEAWRSRLRSTEGELRVVEARRAALARGNRSTRGATTSEFNPDAGLHDVQSALPADGALLEWCVARGAIAAVVVRPSGACLVTIPSKIEAVSAAVEAFRFHVARRLHAGSSLRFASKLHAECLASLSRLHQLLLAPLEAALDGVRQIHHVPAGELTSVPLHALYDGRRFAIERWAVTTSPSASAAVALAGSSRRDGPRLIVGVGDDNAPAIRDEVRGLARMWPDAIVLADGDATIDRVRREVTRASFIHIAAHGRTPVSSPLSAGLLLADGWWTVSDIESCDLRGAHVILSACESGRAVRVGGDETVGLFRAFLRAGAAELVVSEWAAFDATTHRLMATVASDLARQPRTATESLARSFRHAILALIADGEHPAFWAPFRILAAPLATCVESHTLDRLRHE
jgi:CHAT domain-containing protein/tetratricopeptide (TPR) repeat protein